jgi:hypothetical protein
MGHVEFPQHSICAGLKKHTHGDGKIFYYDKRWRNHAGLNFVTICYNPYPIETEGRNIS